MFTYILNCFAVLQYAARLMLLTGLTLKNNKEFTVRTMSLKKAVMVASLVCLPVSMSVAADFKLYIGQKKPFSLTCTSGNFTGVVEGQIGNHFVDGPRVETTRYKITRNNGQKGGNKANVNLYAHSSPALTQGKAASADAMKQDGQWHDLVQARYRLAPAYKEVEFYYEFIFDKSGADPRCETRSVFFTGY